MLLLNRIIAENNLKKFSGKNRVLRLHIGCGRNYKEGWINVDSSKAKKNLCVDLRKGIPFPGNSIDFIYNEHFIEHLSYEEGFCFLREAYRVLKPKAVLRTAFPDLDTLIEAYQKNTWRKMEWVKLIKADWYPSGCFMLNQCIREDGLHKYMYSVDELKRRLHEAGFDSADVYECQVNQSNYDDLKCIERRADSSVVEAVK
jgi:predicted SAM-dependent methyltransferase